MNKSAIQRFAIWARTEMIERVSQRAYQYDITEDGFGDPNAKTVAGRPLTPEEQRQRRELVERIKQKGYAQVMEEVAYTWFNRFIALRFLEVNNYLPSHTRVFSDSTGLFKPEILDDAVNLELPGLDKSKVLAYIEKNRTEDLYRYLLLTQCNALNEALPGMFERMGGYTEMLLPNNILRQDSVLGRMVSDIPEEDWLDAVQIIGWLYQYYNDQRKNEVINIYKGTVKKADIPAATQLFTTDWVVRYMVDNSLGRYWIERHPESKLAEKLEFFVTPKDGTIQHINEQVRPEDVKFLDPCMGSGHILVYAFDVLMEIYKESGYSEREAAALIVQNNLFGLDIDDRASQLAYFAVMMKARSFDRHFLSRGIKPNVFAIQESNGMGAVVLGGVTADAQMNAVSRYLVTTFRDAKELGSIITVEPKDYDGYIAYLDSYDRDGQLTMDDSDWLQNSRPMLRVLARQAKVLAGKYPIICTNPPYLNKIEGRLKTFVTEEYKDYSGDLFSVFIYRNLLLCKRDGYCGYMTPFVWMFIKTYEKLREFIIQSKSITTLIQMEYSAFEEATVPICSFVLKNGRPTGKGLCFKLSDFKGGMEVQKQKVLEAIANKNCGYFYEADQSNFSKIPGSPVAYWVSENFVSTFQKGISIDSISKYTGSQNITANNDKYLRLLWEVSDCDIGEKKRWVFYIKGGTFRKWYGNIELVVDWSDSAVAFYKRNPTSNLLANEYRFREGITYTELTSGINSFRYLPPIAIFDKKGPCIVDVKYNKYCLGFFNSSVAVSYFKLLNPTITLQVKDVKNTPIIIDKAVLSTVNYLVDDNVVASRLDWDSYETSWDFKRSPLV